MIAFSSLQDGAFSRSPRSSSCFSATRCAVGNALSPEFNTTSGGEPAANRDSSKSFSCLVGVEVTAAFAYFFRYCAAPNPPQSSATTTSSGRSSTTPNGFPADRVGPLPASPKSTPPAQPRVRLAKQSAV